MPRFTTCPTCRGTTKNNRGEPGKCPRCAGTGQLAATDDRGKGDHKAPKRRRRR